MKNIHEILHGVPAQAANSAERAKFEQGAEATRVVVTALHAAGFLPESIDSAALLVPTSQGRVRQRLLVSPSQAAIMQGNLPEVVSDAEVRDHNEQEFFHDLTTLTDSYTDYLRSKIPRRGLPIGLHTWAEQPDYTLAGKDVTFRHRVMYGILKKDLQGAAVTLQTTEKMENYIPPEIHMAFDGKGMTEATLAFTIAGNEGIAVTTEYLQHHLPESEKTLFTFLKNVNLFFQDSSMVGKVTMKYSLRGVPTLQLALQRWDGETYTPEGLSYTFDAQRNEFTGTKRGNYQGTIPAVSVADYLNMVDATLQFVQATNIAPSLPEEL